MFFFEIKNIEEFFDTVYVFFLTRRKSFSSNRIDQDLNDEVSSSKRIPVDREAFFLNHI